MNLQCNTTLNDETVANETKSYGSLTFHELGLILSACFGLFAVILSFFLMHMHATHYLKPWEQRHIIRILFMVPIYSVVSFLSYYKYQHYVYYQVLRDCYDAFAISSFFSLLCHYIAPDLHNQKEYFRRLTPKNWLLPVNWFQRCCGSTERGCWRIPRSGLTWFNIIWFCVFQYCFVRVFFTIVAVIAQATGRYCVEGLSPEYAHVWISVITAIAVTFAMYCLIQFYYQIREDIAEYQPFLKLLSIKLVIFFVFWQTIILGYLNDSGVIKSSDKIAQPDITVGIPAVLICIEMAFFAILHIWAYPYKAYDVKQAAGMAETGAGYGLDTSAYKGGFLGWKAYLDAFNPWDIIKATARGFKWAVVGRKHREQDISYKQHLQSTTPLQDASNTKMGSYEPLSGNGDDFGDSRQSYEPYGQQAPRSTYNPNSVNSTLDQRTLMPGRERDNGPTSVSSSAPRQGQFLADPGYHGTGPVGQGIQMPDENTFHAR